jgi:Flp pilus assembly protein TadD
MPGLAIAHFRLGIALEKDGETAEALQEYSRAAELAPGEAQFRANYQRLSRDSKTK